MAAVELDALVLLRVGQGTYQTARQEPIADADKLKII